MRSARTMLRTEFIERSMERAMLESVSVMMEGAF
jgi:hypothetical protein